MPRRQKAIEQDWTDKLRTDEAAVKGMRCSLWTPLIVFMQCNCQAISCLFWREKNDSMKVMGKKLNLTTEKLIYCVPSFHFIYTLDNSCCLHLRQLEILVKNWSFGNKQLDLGLSQAHVAVIFVHFKRILFRHNMFVRLYRVYRTDSSAFIR